ncbi:MAG: GFA family protein [Pseudomonadota bacterium]
MIGGCTCGAVRYELTRPPLFTHCCHCTWCQRETGSAFVLNALIEAPAVSVLRGTPVDVPVPSESGGGQVITRCPVCQVALWSVYSGAGPAIRFVKVGTLDAPAQVPPDIHIFTRSKQPWVQLAGDIPAVPEYYQRSKFWPAASLERRKAALS